MAGKISIKTKRLILEALDDAALAEQILTERDEEWRKLLTGKLTEVQENRDALPWFTVWKAALRKTGETVGYLHFCGPHKMGTVEAVCIPRTGAADGTFMEEALEGMADWAFAQQDVYRVVAEGMPYVENPEGKRLLHGDDGRISIEKGPSLWLPVYMCLGISIGLSLGIIGNRLGIGAAAGLLIGLLIGHLMDTSERKHRAEVTGESATDGMNEENERTASVTAEALEAAADASGNSGPGDSEFEETAGEFSGEDGGNAGETEN